MKHIKLMTIVAATAMLAVSCGQKKEAPKDESPKYLVLYYSQTSNTKAVAEQIANLLNADIEEIVATQPYDGDFQATIERCIQERELGVKPEIQPLTADISQYDVIFIGYPVWFGTYAPPVAAWLNQADLSGKKVVPFCTFGSGGLESSAKDLAAKQPNAEVLPGYGVRAARLEAMPKEPMQIFRIGQGKPDRMLGHDPQRKTHCVADLVEDRLRLLRIVDRSAGANRTDHPAAGKFGALPDGDLAGETAGQFHAVRTGEKGMIHRIDPAVERTTAADGAFGQGLNVAFPGTVGLPLRHQITLSRTDLFPALVAEHVGGDRRKHGGQQTNQDGPAT